MKKFIKSANYALYGLKYIILTQRNFRIQILFALISVVFGFLLNINFTEWCILIICISMVCVMEIINTTIEYLCDFVNPGLNLKIKIIKDLSAAAVIFAAIAAFIVGVLIFLPKIFMFF